MKKKHKEHWKQLEFDFTYDKRKSNGGKKIKHYRKQKLRLKEQTVQDEQLNFPFYDADNL
jgi:hypothetical protein